MAELFRTVCADCGGNVSIDSVASENGVITSCKCLSCKCTKTVQVPFSADVKVNVTVEVAEEKPVEEKKKGKKVAKVD